MTLQFSPLFHSLEEPINNNNNQRRPSIHNRQRQRDYNQFNHNINRPMMNVGRQMNFNRPPLPPPQLPQQQQQPFIPSSPPPSRYMAYPIQQAPPQQPFRNSGGGGPPQVAPNFDPNYSNYRGNDDSFHINDGGGRNNYNHKNNNNFNSNSFNNNNNNNNMNDPYVLFNNNNGPKHPKLDFRKPMINNNPSAQQSDRMSMHHGPNRPAPPSSPPSIKQFNIDTHSNNQAKENFNNPNDNNNSRERDQDNSDYNNNQVITTTRELPGRLIIQPKMKLMKSSDKNTKRIVKMMNNQKNYGRLYNN